MAGNREHLELLLAKIDCMVEPIESIEAEHGRETLFNEPARRNFRRMYRALLACSQLARDPNKAVDKITQPITQNMSAALAALSDKKKGPREGIHLAHKHLREIQQGFPGVRKKLRKRASQLRI